jgi:hypothetical protein
MDETILRQKAIRRDGAPSLTSTEDELLQSAKEEEENGIDFAGEKGDDEYSELPSDHPSETAAAALEYEADVMALESTDGTQFNLNCDLNLTSRTLLDFLADDNRYAKPTAEGDTECTPSLKLKSTKPQSDAELLSDAHDVEWDSL